MIWKERQQGSIFAGVWSLGFELGEILSFLHESLGSYFSEKDIINFSTSGFDLDV